MTTALPAYLDAFLAAIAAGADFDSVHLGHWDAPPPHGPADRSSAFAQAQDRLTSILLAMLDAKPRDRVLDVGCGLGGAIKRLAHCCPHADLHGLNIDARQIAVCRRFRAPRAQPAWVVADATRLPYADATFDRVLCIEAQFHFAGRRRFFEEVRRVLRAGGSFVASDILLRSSADLAPRREKIERILDRDFGPWPEKWVTADEMIHVAASAGLRCDRVVDATDNTFPSYVFIAPHDRVAPGVVMMRDLQAEGHLRYVYLKFTR